MAKITVDYEEFLGFVFIYLYVILKHEDELRLTDPDLVNMIESLKNRGLLTPLLKYYTGSSLKLRTDELRIRPTLLGKTYRADIINIYNKVIELDDEEEQ